jgi:hypothetical protein
VAQLYGVPNVILQVFIIILYQNVFQNPELFPTQVSLSPKQSTLLRSFPNFVPSVGHKESKTETVVIVANMSWAKLNFFVH